MVVRESGGMAARAQAVWVELATAALRVVTQRGERPVWVVARVAAVAGGHVAAVVVPMAGAVTGSRDGFIQYS